MPRQHWQTQPHLTIFLRKKQKALGKVPLHFVLLGQEVDPEAADYAKQLTDDDPDLVIEALEALAEKQESAEPFVRSVVGLLKDDEPSIRRACSDCLMQVAHFSPFAFRKLVSMFQHWDDSIRRVAHAVLENLVQQLSRDNAHKCARLLAPCMDDRREEVRLQTLNLLLKFDTHVLAPLGKKLAQGLMDDSKAVQNMATILIGDLGPKGLTFEGELKQLRANGETDIAAAAAQALTKLAHFKRGTVGWTDALGESMRMGNTLSQKSITPRDWQR